MFPKNSRFAYQKLEVKIQRSNVELNKVLMMSKRKIYVIAAVIGAVGIAIASPYAVEETLAMLDPRYIQFPEGSTNILVNGKAMKLDRSNSIKLGGSPAGRATLITFTNGDDQFRFETVLSSEFETPSTELRTDGFCGDEKRSKFYRNGKLLVKKIKVLESVRSQNFISR